MKAAEFFGYDPVGEAEARFALGSDVHGAFGGVFGGAAAAACVTAARPLAAGRRPFSLHVTFVRGLSTPTCTATSEVVNAGRTVTTVAVDLRDEVGKLASRATVTFADEEALAPRSSAGGVAAPSLSTYDEGRSMRSPSSSFTAPIVEVLSPRLVGSPDGGHAQAVRIPWDDDPSAAAEAACMAADFCVGMPVAAALEGGFVPIPNPDLSLRFLDEQPADVLVGVGRLGRIDGGVAATAVEVWAGERLVALGLSSTVLLGR